MCLPLVFFFIFAWRMSLDRSTFFVSAWTSASSQSSLLLVKGSSLTGSLSPLAESNDAVVLDTASQKLRLLQLGASLDRGQAYNPTSGEYYKDRMDVAIQTIQSFLAAHPNNVPKSMDDIKGEWELVLSTVPHGIFRSSPFFLAIQEAYDVYADNKDSFGMKKSDLFFKLHELQTCSWGISKVGRVAQFITDDYLYSEFDTSIFSLTVIPIFGWFKLLPTFGGCVITAAKAELQEGGVLQMKVDYTTSRPVAGLNGLGAWIWNIRVPVGFLWKLLPWNKGRDAVCKVNVLYVDSNFRIVQDISGDFFVYTRPVVPPATGFGSHVIVMVKDHTVHSSSILFVQQYGYGEFSFTQACSLSYFHHDAQSPCSGPAMARI